MLIEAIKYDKVISCDSLSAHLLQMLVYFNRIGKDKKDKKHVSLVIPFYE